MERESRDRALAVMGLSKVSSPSSWAQTQSPPTYEVYIAVTLAYGREPM
jgi:hypothetical protein